MKEPLSPANLAILQRLPLFSIEHRDTKDDKIVWSGRLARVGTLGKFLISEAGDVVLGDWLKVDEDKTHGEFQINEILVGDSAADLWRNIGYYWGERVERVLARRTWALQEYVTRDCISYPADGGKPTVMPGGWGHDHCANCWTKIGAGGEKRGYENEGDWVCTECHEKYVAPISLGFLDDERIIEQAGGLIDPEPE